MVLIYNIKYGIGNADFNDLNSLFITFPNSISVGPLVFILSVLGGNSAPNLLALNVTLKAFD